LRKGSVITGKVTNAKGEPMVALSVQAILVRDGNGRPTQNSYAVKTRGTDNRGVYRLYGLQPGSYLLKVSGNSSPLPPHQPEAPTFYPASRREAAEEVTVRLGEETSGIDITYRGETGLSVSGTLSGAVGKIANNSRVTITLAYDPSGAVVAATTMTPERKFLFTGIAEGDYLIIARRSQLTEEDNGLISPTRRITVKNADATGIELALQPLSSVAGRVIFAELPEAEHQAACAAANRPAASNLNITNRREDETTPVGYIRPPAVSGARVDEKGEFSWRYLESGRYRVTAQLTHPGWYVRAITLPSVPLSTQSRDVARQGYLLNPGQRLENLTVTLAEGAAMLAGRIVTASEGASLPSRLRVFIVPAERSDADNVLRYTQTGMRPDGRFSFPGLAPGRYWLLARPLSGNETSASLASPSAWPAAERAELRREAEAANMVIELQPCQRVSDYTLRYAAAAGK
jgi:hypothetical protein